MNLYLDFWSSGSTLQLAILLIAHDGVNGRKEIFATNHYIPFFAAVIAAAAILAGILEHFADLKPFLIAVGEPQIITCLK